MQKNQKIITWNELIHSCDELTKKIRAGRDEFTDIVALSRGGLLPAQYIAYQLNIDRVYTIGINYYTDRDQQLIPALYQGLSNSFHSRRVLIVDELIDTGKTVEFAISELKHRWCKYIRTACLWYKESSVIHPDYALSVTPEHTWIVMPYDKEKD